MNNISPIEIQITEPGLYDLSAERYHADPCPTPSLSAGMIRDLLIAPAVCKENSARLNPGWEEPEGAERFTIGTVSHVMFLEPHLFSQRVVVCDFDDWRKGEAKAKRDAVKAAGKTPILSKHMDRIHAARKAFLAHGFVKGAFSGGKFEQSMFWRHPKFGFWCRARPDFLHEGLAHICDYKTTASANPNKFGKHAMDLAYHSRAAWYLEGCRVLFDKTPAHYWFVNQETKAPYLTSVVELDWMAIEAGQSENDRAAGIFDRCLNRNEWPGYRHPNEPDRDLAFQVGLPNFYYTQIEGRI